MGSLIAFGMMLGGAVKDLFGRSSAKRKLRDMQKNGLEREVWYVDGWKGANYPNKTSWWPNESLKQKSESSQGYIGRYIKEGEIKKLGERVYVGIKNIALKFAIKKESVTKTSENVLVRDEFNDCEEIIFPLEDIEGEVKNITNHNYLLNYLGYIDMKEREDFRIMYGGAAKKEKPGKVEFVN